LYLLGSTTHESGGIHQQLHLLVDRREVSALFYPAQQSVTGIRIHDEQAGVANTELLDLDTNKSPVCFQLNRGENGKHNSSSKKQLQSLKTS
jgi:hypothetical protein